MRDITLCHPRLQVLAAKLVEECSRQRIQIKIGETLRTVAEQDALYAQGRTKPGNIVTNAKGSNYSSYHQWGVAFDFFRNDGTGAYNESGNFFARVGAIGVTLGLEWGGNWKSPVDKPHFQLPDWGSSTSGIKKKYANPEEFMRTWERQVGWIEDGIGWWYRNTEGSYPVSKWEQIADKWYWFNESGYAYKGQWLQDQDKWYYLDDTCAMATGLQVIDSKVYYFERSGAMTTKPVTLKPDQDGVIH